MSFHFNMYRTLHCCNELKLATCSQHHPYPANFLLSPHLRLRSCVPPSTRPPFLPSIQVIDATMDGLTDRDRPTDVPNNLAVLFMTSAPRCPYFGFKRGEASYG